MSRVIVPKIDPREEIKDFLGVLVPDEILIPDAETFFYTQEDLYDLVMERPPFFMVNRAVAIGTDMVLSVAHISVTRCEGHFPKRPIVPLIRMCECAAQSGLVLVALNVSDDKVPMAFGSGNSIARTKDVVEPPVTILFYGKKVREKMGLFVVDSEFFVEGKNIGALQGIKCIAPLKTEIFPTA